MKKVLSNDNWILMGRAFGYPDCCIRDFCTRGFKLTSDQEKAHQGTGFVPCPKHATQVASGEVKLKDLIKNRDSRLKKFPLE